MGGRTKESRLGRTLVIGVNWLGDTIMSLPAIVALRDHLGEEELHFEAPASLGALVRLTGVVDAILYRGDGVSTRGRIEQLRRGNYHRAVVFPNSFRSAWVAWRAGIPERYGYKGQWRGWLLNGRVPRSRSSARRHQSEVYLEIVRSLGWKGAEVPSVRLALPEEALAWGREVIGEGLKGRPLVGICPGAAYGPAKRWAAEGFFQVAAALRDRHGATIVLMGNAKEAASIQWIAGALGHGFVDMSGSTDSERLAALLSLCDLVVCNDSGPMHLASLLGTPVVAIFGSTDPSATGPTGRHRIVKASVECSPCFRRKCIDGSYRCLEAITPADVLSAAEALLEEALSEPGSLR